MGPFFAHSVAGRPRSNWEPLAEHEARTARLARLFLSRIHPPLDQWGELLGRWHDLGKYLEEFQERFDGKAVFVDHAGVVRANAD